MAKNLTLWENADNYILIDKKAKKVYMMESKLKRMFQIGIAVPDAIAAAENFCRLFDIDEKEIQIIDGRDEEPIPMLYNGKETLAAMVIAMVNVAGVEFEFVQHYSGDTNYHKDYLEKHGSGIHHICIDVANYQDMVDKMSAMGGKVINDGGQGDFSYKYLDMRESMGIVFEMYNDGLRDLKMNNK